jgi:hypothetical protein
MSKVIEIDCSTGISTERDMTEAELEAQAAMQAQAEENRAAKDAAKAALDALKASAKAKLVAGQPLTEEEAATIVL